MHDVIVIGAGAAGLLAAVRAAEQGAQTLLLEKNRKPAVKILMSGGTRCNITQATDVKGIVAAYGATGKFLHSALASLDPQAVVDLFHAEGVLTKVESTGKIFPVSDKAQDVQQALLRRLARSGAELIAETPITAIHRTEEGFSVVGLRQTWTGRALILTTGGQSYPGCGTTGDGYAWAAAMGHMIVPPRPALVPITSTAEWVRGLSGVTLPDVLVRVLEPDQRKPLTQQQGSLLFTHFGLSGPAILNVSRVVSGHPRPTSLTLECDLLPDSHEDQLLADLQQAGQATGNQLVLNRWTEHLPRRVAEAVFGIAEISLTRKCAELSKVERGRLLSATKRLPIPITGTLGFEKAEVTAGGVALSEVDSRTMESKLVPNLYFAGEILDLDGPIGGYNFQAAFSTGWLAGTSAANP
ncbi:MAG: N-methyltryptophan oxidase, partial [Planctomycetaceae bacterium]|nr:N-methyltryptophan oxidase [Planctomycetaceae bacterium]